MPGRMQGSAERLHPVVCSDVKSGELATVLTGVTSQNSHVGREAGDHPFHPPGAGDTGGFGMSPERETPPPPWPAVPVLC